MNDLALSNDKVRFEAKFGKYFFARCLVKQNVIDATVTARKYKKFLAALEEMFTDETAMSDIWKLAIQCKIKVDHSSH